MRLVIYLVLAGFAFASSAEALSRKRCRESCGEKIYGCMADGFGAKGCRKFFVRACRKQGVTACHVTTTTIELPTTTTQIAALPTTTSTSGPTPTTSTTLVPLVNVSVQAWANYNVGTDGFCAGTVAVAVEITNKTNATLPVDGLLPDTHAVMNIHSGGTQCGANSGQTAVSQAVREDFCAFVLTSIGPDFCIPCSPANPVPPGGTRRCAAFFLHYPRYGADVLRYQPLGNCVGFVPFGCSYDPPPTTCPSLPVSREWACR